ncbi:MAG: ABC transporter ATP-binding protein [Chloroflexi bacterium]|nr:ABC transporter ATP-binding protein [Chloroflexota bacterium]
MTIYDDEILGKAYDGRLVRRLLGFVWPYKWSLTGAIGLMVGSALMELIPPFLIRTAIDGPIATGDIDGIWPIFLLYAATLLASFGFRYAQTYVMQAMSQRIIIDIRMAIFRHIQKMSLKFFDHNPVGRLLTRITNDVDALNEFITQGTVALLGDLVRLFFIIVTMLILSWQLALVSFIMFPVVIISTIIFQKIMRATYREMRQRLARINAYLNEQITGVLVTQLFGREGRSRQFFTEISSDYLKSQFKSNNTFAVFFPTVHLTSVSATALLLLLGGQLVLNDVTSIGLLVAFTLYTEQAFGPIRQLAERYNTLQSAMASSERIFRVLDTSEDIADPAAPKQLPTPVRGAIVFDNVIFGYNPSEPVLKGVSFTIPAGQAVAVVGASGAGKTSLVSLMARFYEIQQGSIRLDGVDIREITQHDLRKHVGAVPQDPTCFSGSIAQNIRLHDDTITDERIRWAADISGASSFIHKLPGQFAYEVRERGSNLSVGQRQLLSFARAMAFNPEVLLILDEATSSVDTETEAVMQQAVQRLLKGRTSIVIAHRLSTIRYVDRILVLHRGLLVEDGTHDELLALNGYYARLYTLQYAEQLGGSAAEN